VLSETRSCPVSVKEQAWSREHPDGELPNTPGYLILAVRLHGIARSAGQQWDRMAREYGLKVTRGGGSGGFMQAKGEPPGQ
jgi:hypothetical protein